MLNNANFIPAALPVLKNTVREIEKSTSAGSAIFEREMLEKQWEAGLKICGGLEAEKETMKLSGGSNPLQHPGLSIPR